MEVNMGTTYVVDGAIISCTMGVGQSTLKVSSSRSIELCGSKEANIGDTEPVGNIQPFSACTISSPPIPCVPEFDMWSGGKDDVLIENLPALLSDSTLICNAGAGIITIDDDGQ